MAASVADITRFLSDFNNAGPVYLVPRAVNKVGLNALGLTNRAALALLKGLTAADYCKGPEKDTDQPGEVWMFGLVVGVREAYIKLKRDGNGAKCISFHPATFALRFPHKNAVQNKPGANAT